MPDDRADRQGKAEGRAWELLGAHPTSGSDITLSATEAIPWTNIAAIMIPTGQIQRLPLYMVANI